MSKLTIPIKITGTWLRRHGACDSQADRFDEVFPHGVTRITVTTIKKARAARLDPSWVAEKAGLAHGNSGVTCLLCAPGRDKDLAAAMRARQRKAAA